MKTQSKFWWFVAVAIVATTGVLVTISFLFWRQLSEVHQQYLITIFSGNLAYFFGVGFLLFTAFGFTLDWFFRFYIIPVNQLADETQIINTVNPDLRIKIQGSHDVRRLAEIINQIAQKQADMQQSIERQLQKNQTTTEAEKGVLASLLEGLAQGILVCNNNGQIVFYNRKVKYLLGSDDSQSNKTQLIGLDRSIYAFIEKTLITRALERISQKLAEGRTDVIERFLIGSGAKPALPAEIIPVLDSQHHITGFIINIEDLVVKLHKEQELSRHLQDWQHQLTQSVSVIKTAAEILNAGSFQKDQDRDKFIEILTQESDLAAKLLTQNDIADKWTPNRPWLLTPADAGEWGRFLAHRAADVVDVNFDMVTRELQSQISIDMHHLTSAMIFIISKIDQDRRVDEIQGHFYQRDAWLYLDIIWKGIGITHGALNGWKSENPSFHETRLDMSLEDILNYHGAKLWICHHHMPEGCTGLRLLLPALERSEIHSSDGQVTILPDSRPEFYDFNLFQQDGQTPELDNRLLTELTYTVFDTETTGLDPQGGDEIISIGALRIVNGRLLREDQFNQLIDPQRHLPWASVKFHGIRPEMLIDQPTISEVLPTFKQFVQDTILVGHNVAFDMRMLQLKESSTGIVFSNPILDTMLLSAVVHPAHTSQKMSAITDRLGVEITGRHTALGDANATGGIFLKLIPLLANMGIKTLGQARQASEKTFYARLKY